MSLIELGRVIHNTLGLRSILDIPVHSSHKEIPSKFKTIIDTAFDPNHPDISLLVSDSEKLDALWDDPQAVEEIFLRISQFPETEAEQMLRKYHLLKKIGIHPSAHIQTVKQIITTLIPIDEREYFKITGRQAHPPKDCTHCKYHYTYTLIASLNGLVENPEFRGWLNETVGFDSKEAFKEIRDSHHHR